MNAAVVRECAGGKKLVGETVARLMDIRVPKAGGMTRNAGSRAMKAGIPIPFDLVTRLDRDCGGNKRIPVLPDMDDGGLA